MVRLDLGPLSLPRLLLPSNKMEFVSASMLQKTVYIIGGHPLGAVVVQKKKDYQQVVQEPS